MRVAVVGGSGNVGTALLRALLVAPEVTSVLGISRRVPTGEPYASADWASFDIGRPVTSDAEERAQVDELAEHLAGVDAVVHLAWLIQPNRERDKLRRTNVDGTDRVVRASALAGVRQIVVASSVGAYSSVHDDAPRREDHDTRGVVTSHYSVDKVAQERVLDAFEAEHPEIRVARLRPGLIFQSDAGAEIHRYFLGPLVPRALLKPGALPVMPWPRGFRLQAVHADDMAQAYLLAVLKRASGAFNIAADDVLHGRDVAKIAAGGGPLIEVPPPVVRTLLAVAYALHLVPVDPGWLDMASGAPVMDTTRAKEVLGWRPTHTAASSMASLMAGMAGGRGTASAPMRPA